MSSSSTDAAKADAAKAGLGPSSPKRRVIKGPDGNAVQMKGGGNEPESSDAADGEPVPKQGRGDDSAADDAVDINPTQKTGEENESAEDKTDANKPSAGKKGKKGKRNGTDVSKRIDGHDGKRVSNGLKGDPSAKRKSASQRSNSTKRGQSGEISLSNLTPRQLEGKVRYLTSTNKSLRAEIKELKEAAKKFDKKESDVKKAVEANEKKWKKQLKEKDEEVAKYKERAAIAQAAHGESSKAGKATVDKWKQQNKQSRDSLDQEIAKAGYNVDVMKQKHAAEIRKMQEQYAKLQAKHKRELKELSDKTEQKYGALETKCARDAQAEKDYSWRRRTNGFSCAPTPPPLVTWLFKTAFFL